jgi:hypothetical protein
MFDSDYQPYVASRRECAAMSFPLPLARAARHQYQKSFYKSVTGATATVMAYGSFISLSSPITPSVNVQHTYSSEYLLKSADGKQALFKTRDGLCLVMVGSLLGFAGSVEAIEKQNGRWIVTTSKHMTFVQN